MKPIDSKLQYLQLKATLSEERVHVLLRCKNNVSVLAQFGFQATSQTGNVAAGFIFWREP
jgi:hypothetical protein